MDYSKETYELLKGFLICLGQATRAFGQTVLDHLGEGGAAPGEDQPPPPPPSTYPEHPIESYPGSGVPPEPPPEP